MGATSIDWLGRLANLEAKVLSGASVSGAGSMPSSVSTFFGGLASSAIFGTFREEGNLYRNVGNPIAGNAADTTDDILCGIVLDAAAFDAAGRGLCVTVSGLTGATTNNKRFKMWINPTTSGTTITNGVISGGTVTAAGSGALIADSGTWVNATTPNNAAGWQSMVQLFKYGAAGSNTQYSQAQNILGTLHGGIAAPVMLTQSEAASMSIIVTGASYTTGAANDLKANFFEVNAMN